MDTKLSGVTATPPMWAEFALRAFLASRDRETVPGDLLEEYRERVSAMGGRAHADAWYLRQVLWYAWRKAGVWAMLFAIAFVARTAIDWHMPTTDFQMRSTVSTIVGVGILLAAGFWAGSRSGSVTAGALFGIATAALAVPMQAVGALVLFIVQHDQGTMMAIRQSGGLEEVFTWPLVTVLPAMLLGGIGSALAVATKRLRSI